MEVIVHILHSLLKTVVSNWNTIYFIENLIKMNLFYSLYHLYTNLLKYVVMSVLRSEVSTKESFRNTVMSLQLVSFIG